MKKIILFILLIPLINAQCDDSDGINYYEKGITSGINDADLGGFIMQEDHCEADTLYEYYCMDLSKANTKYDVAVAKIEYKCLNGCENGVCLGECIPICQYSSICDESAPDGCGNICTRNTDGISCDNGKCEDGVCVTEKEKKSYQKKEECILYTVCSLWSDCIDGKKKRECENGCGSYWLEQTSCEIVLEQKTIKPEIKEIPVAKKTPTQQVVKYQPKKPFTDEYGLLITLMLAVFILFLILLLFIILFI